MSLVTQTKMHFVRNPFNYISLPDMQYVQTDENLW